MEKAYLPIDPKSISCNHARKLSTSKNRTQITMMTLTIFIRKIRMICVLFLLIFCVLNG